MGDESTKQKKLWCQKIEMASGKEIPYDCARVRWGWEEIGQSITWIGNMGGLRLDTLMAWIRSKISCLAQKRDGRYG
jgi:hypothetical protein